MPSSLALILPQKSVTMTSPATLPSTFGNNYHPHHTPPRSQQEQQHHHQQQGYHHLQSSQQHFHISHQKIMVEQGEQSLPDQHDHSPRNQNHFPHHYHNYRQQQQYPQYQPHPHQVQQYLHSYRNHRRTMHENDNENEAQDYEDQDLDEDEEEEQDEDQRRHPYSNGEHSAYNSAYNSETEDVNMDCVALKKEHDLDHDMSELPSSSSASSSSSSLTTTPAPFTKNSIATTHHNHCPYPPQAQEYPHRPYHTLLPAPSSSSSTISLKAKQSSSPSAAASTLAIKPRPTLRPLLPSRPTSPQPMLPSRTNIDSSDSNTPVSSGPFSSSMSSSSRPQNNSVPLFGSTNTNTNNSTESNSSSSNGNNDNNDNNDNAAAKTRQSAYKINGLNILNRNSLDSRTALEMIRRRRENHNHVERRRRDTLNSTIHHIAEILPNCSTSAKLNKGTILRLALDHLRSLNAENHSLRSENAALRFFYQGSPTRRPEQHPTGPSGPSPPLLSLPPATTTSAPPNASVAASSSFSHSHLPSRGSSMSGPPSSHMSDTGIPPIIPGPGKGMIPSLGVRPGSAANSPPGQHLHSPAASANNSGHSISGVKRSMSASGHLQPILLRNQQSSSSRVSPSPSAHHPRASPSSSSSGMVTSSPCSSPTLDPLSTSSSTHHPVSAPTPVNVSALHAMANALPSVPASHQHSAAVSAAAAAAAAAANRTLNGTPQPLPLIRHQKSHSGGSSSSGSGSGQSGGPGSSPMMMHHHHHHHHHHHSPQSQAQQLQVHAKHNPGGYGSFLGHGGSGGRLPSLESLTDSSSPMASPIQGPSNYSNRASPSVSLPGPMDPPSIGQPQQQQQRHSTSGQGQAPGYSRVHPTENVNHPVLPPLAPRP